MYSMYMNTPNCEESISTRDKPGRRIRSICQGIVIRSQWKSSFVILVLNSVDSARLLAAKHIHILFYELEPNYNPFLKVFDYRQFNRCFSECDD